MKVLFHFGVVRSKITQLRARNIRFILYLIFMFPSVLYFSWSIPRRDTDQKILLAFFLVMACKQAPTSTPSVYQRLGQRALIGLEVRCSQYVRGKRNEEGGGGGDTSQPKNNLYTRLLYRIFSYWVVNHVVPPPLMGVSWYHPRPPWLDPHTYFIVL